MFVNTSCSFKISIVGCGNVGATAAYALLLEDFVSDLTLIDANKDHAEGIAMDLEHSLSFTSFVRINSSDDVSACEGSQLIIITAGKKQQPGQTRLDLAKANKALFEELIPRIVKAAPQALLMIVSNPVDVMTYSALKISGYAPRQVFGTGTALDSARLQFHISEKLMINPRSIDAYIMGEHGDSSFPVWSSANVLGKPLRDMEGFNQTIADECYEKTKTAAYRIIHDIGFTAYSIATTIREISRAIFQDRNEVFMLSTLIKGYYGHSDVCVSMPCVIGRGGIVKTIDVPLDAHEQELLQKSVETVRSYNTK